jgi:hypothetical protein
MKRKLNKRLSHYHNFVDSLVKLKEGVLGHWITKKGFPDLKENKKINEFLLRMTAKDRKIVASLVQQGRMDGIHDTLVFLQDKINTSELKIVKEGVELAVEPYGTTLYWDWTCRCEGDDWPSDDLEDDYK